MEFSSMKAVAKMFLFMNGNFVFMDEFFML